MSSALQKTQMESEEMISLGQASPAPLKKADYELKTLAHTSKAPTTRDALNMHAKPRANRDKDIPKVVFVIHDEIVGRLGCALQTRMRAQVEVVRRGVTNTLVNNCAGPKVAVAIPVLTLPRGDWYLHT